VSIEKKAARGVAWNMAMSVVTRVFQLAGTLMLTRFIAPAEYGEVSAAAICVFTASQISTFAFGQYLIATKAPPKVAFQAAVLHFGLGVVAMALVILLRAPLGLMVDAPGMGRLIPGFALALLIDRARHVPERLLVRDLRFRTVAIVNSAGELTFTVTALALAGRWGGGAIVAGSLARSVLNAVLFTASAPRREWLVPSPLQAKVVRELFRFGTPMMISAVADRAAATWDNLFMSRLFGPGVMGRYNLSYSLAETPLIYVAERISDVLMPSFAKMEREERQAAVIRAAGLMSLVVAPLGVGLGAVAPTVVQAFFDPRWADMAPMLSILSVMTIFQPAPWSAIAYLQAEKLTRPIMITSIARAVMILGLVVVLGKLGGPLWACVGVGLGYAFHSVITVILAGRLTRLPMGPYFIGVARPLLACIPMFSAVTALRLALVSAHVPLLVSLVAEVVCGAVVYVGAVFVVARSNARELTALGRNAFRRRA
jgi:lipopolysaccharide exporter